MKVIIKDLDNNRIQREADTADLLRDPLSPDTQGAMLAAESGKPVTLGRTVYLPQRVVIGACSVCGGLTYRSGELIECSRCRVAVVGGGRA